MRPAGEIRQAVLQVVQSATPTGATWHDVARQLVPQGIARRAVLHTVKNLARSGAVQPVAWVRAPGVSRAMAAWVVVPEQNSTSLGGMPSLQALRGAWMP